MSPRILAIVVTYLPEPDTLGALLSALNAQVSGVLVVDNTPQANASVEVLVAGLPFSGVRLIRLNDNLGIARALNVGIQEAIRVDADFILLSDQDSLPAPDMVAGLKQSLDVLERDGHRVGAIGPTYTDRHTGITFPFQATIPGKFFYGHATPSAENPIVPVLTLITSGVLIPVPVLRNVGLMREDLFIDYVDTEWCHRANSAGYELFGTLHARMFHRLGDRSLRVWCLGWRNENAYSPLRMYYRTRNFLVLCRMRHVPTNWKIRSAWYWLGLVYTQGCYGHERRAAWRMVARGIRDGLCKRMGVYGSTKRQPDATSNARPD